MSEMIERVARAIEPDAIWITSEHTACDYCTAAKERCLSKARAAIEAMREPTDGQRNVYWEMRAHCHVFDDSTWQAMIDAALAPDEGRDDA